LKRAIGDWLAYLEPPLIRQGHDPAAARSLATIILAGFRGFLLDLCATRDRRRIDRAVGLWLDMIEELKSTPKRKAIA
jgi:hypothetical protein